VARRTSPSDAENITVADDLQDVVHDKREGWRANGAKARRRQRRYTKLVTDHLVRIGGRDDHDNGSFFDE
jgi:hypothetical protein